MIFKEHQAVDPSVDEHHRGRGTGQKEIVKECKLKDLVPDGWVFKEIKTLKAYDKEGHLLWELYDKEEEKINKEEDL